MGLLCQTVPARPSEQKPEKDSAASAAAKTSPPQPNALRAAGKPFVDRTVGVRLVLPPGWKPYPSTFAEHLLFECDPRHPFPQCNLEIDRRKATNLTITDADRKLWESWVSASGMRRIISTRDLVVNGHPAYEVVEGKIEAESRWVFVLVPEMSRLYRLIFSAKWDSRGRVQEYKPAIETVLQSFKSLP